MRIHEKAALYDILLKDYEELIAEMEKVKEELQNIPDRPDLLEIKETQGYSMYTKTPKPHGLNRSYSNKSLILI